MHICQLTVRSNIWDLIFMQVLLTWGTSANVRFLPKRIFWRRGGSINKIKAFFVLNNQIYITFDNALPICYEHVKVVDIHHPPNNSDLCDRK